MDKYAVISGARLLAIVRAKNYKTAVKKAATELAEEYMRRHRIRITKVASASLPDTGI